MKQILWASFFLPTLILAQVPVPASERSRYAIESPPAMPTLSKDDVYIRTSNGKSQIMRGDNTPLSDFFDAIDNVYSGGKDLEKIYIAKKGQHYGIIDKFGKTLGSFDYDNLKTINDGTLIVQKKGLWGIVNRKGEVKIPIVFTNIHYFNDITQQLLATKNNEAPKLFSGTKEQKTDSENITFTKLGVLYQKDGKWLLLNGQDKNALPQTYDEVKISGYSNQELAIPGTKAKYIQNQQPYFLVKKDNYWGIITPNGKIAVPLKYDNITFDSGRSVYNLSREKMKGLFFPGENPIHIEAVYASLHPSFNNTIVAIKDGKYGLLNKKGEVLLPFQYDSMMEYNTDRYLVTQNRLEGMVDSKGKILIPIENEDISSFGGFNFSDYYTIKKNGLYGIVKSNGQIIIPSKYTWIGDYEKIIVGELNNQWTLFDELGFQIYPQTIDHLSRNFGDYPIFYMVKDNKFGLIDTSGKIISPPVYKNLDYMYDERNLKNPHNGSPLVVTDGQNKKGLFDERNKKFLITPTYDDLKQTDGKNIIAKKGTKFGIINSLNTVTIPFNYDDIYLNFIDDKNEEFVAKKGTKYGIINNKNETKIPFEYQNLAKLSYKNLYKASKGKGYQLISSDNKILNTGPFDDILGFEDKKALALQNGKMVLLSEDGKQQSLDIKAEVPNGYKTFEELKFALVHALDSKDDSALRTFCTKIAPNPAMMYYLKDYNDGGSYYLENTASIIDTYYNDLLRFKMQEWQTKRYDRRQLTENKDFDYYENGKITAGRHSLINDFRDETLTNILKGTMKVNGFWYSTYFMKRNFGRY